MQNRLRRDLPKTQVMIVTSVLPQPESSQPLLLAGPLQTAAIEPCLWQAQPGWLDNLRPAGGQHAVPGWLFC